MSFLVVVVIMAVVMLGVRVYQVNRQTPIWRQVAAELGVAAPTGSLTRKLGVYGKLDGIRISIKEVSSEDDTDVIFEAEYPAPRGLGLDVRADIDRRRRDSTLRRLFGRSAIPLDDEHVDATLWVKGDDPDRVAAFLTPSRQHAIASLVRRLPNAAVRDDKITLSIEGRVDKLDDVAATMRSMHEVALLMHRQTDELDGALDRIEEGDLGEGLAILRAVKPPLRRAALRMAAEIMVSGAGTAADVAEVLDEMQLEAIEDHEVEWLRGWVREAVARQHAAPDDHPVIGDPRLASAAAPDPGDRVPQSPPPPVADALPSADVPSVAAAEDLGVAHPSPPEEVAEAGPGVGDDRLIGDPRADDPSPPPPAPVPDADAQAAVLAALFEGDATAGRERFEQELLGTTIAWEGTVRRSRSFGHDLDLGAGPGLKVVVRIGEVDLGDYGDGEVDAVVAFAPDAEMVEGDRIRFTAVPIRLDGFTRNVFCAGGVVLD